MNRDALLADSSAAFLNAFQIAVNNAVMRATKATVLKSGFSLSHGEQRILFDAHRLLQAKTVELRTHLQTQMAQLLERSIQTAYSTLRPTSSYSFTSNTLSLVESADLEDQLRIDDITARFRNTAEQPLRDLNLRIAVLFEQHAIKERENPFRPWLFTRCIANAVELVCPRSDLAVVLCHQIAENLEESIVLIYNAVNLYLAAHGIAAQLQLKVERTPGSGSPLAGGQADTAQFPYRSNTAATGQVPAMDKSGTDLNPVIANTTLEHLMDNIRNIATRIEPVGSKSHLPPAIMLPPGLDSLVSQAINIPLTGLPQRQQPTDAMQPATNQILTQRGPLLGAAGDISEQLTTHMVAMLFDFILHDTQIPAEIRADLGRLRLHLLAIAFTESTLFTDPAHPVRMLINRIGAVSIGRQGHDPDDARISVEISRMVDALLTDETGSSAPFLPMLEHFDCIVANVFKSGNADVKLAADLIEQVQNRTLRLTQITDQLDTILSGLVLDDFLHDFLLSTWVHVVEHAERAGLSLPAEATTGTAKAAARYKLLVPDLLWSIVPQAESAGKAQQLALMPRIVQTVRDGLSMVGWPPQRQQPVLDWLLDVHRAAMHDNGEAATVQSLASVHNAFGRFLRSGQPLPTCEKSNAAAQQAILDVVMHEAGDHLTLLDKITTADLMTGDGTTSDALDTTVNGDTSLNRSLFEPLRIDIGIGIEVLVAQGSTPVQARLRWIDHRAAILVLTVGSENTPCLIGMCLFQRLERNGSLRILETTPLFERAVGTVLQSLAPAQQSVST